LNQRIRELLERLNNKIMQKLGYSRAELFIQLDKPALKPLPEAHRQHATWTPERLLEWAGHIGSETHSYVLHILNSRPHPEQ
ncbi:IS21 family transposase, partial [Escherichia coli]|nr:IS21 family transposase [Escherichia coli]